MRQKGCGCDEVVEGRTVLIVAVAHAEMASTSGGRQASGGLGTQRPGSSRDWAAFPLLEALVDAQSLVGVREQGMQGLHMDQQQRGCGKLRGAESIGMKKSAQHSRNICRNKAGPSVLPCPGR